VSGHDLSYFSIIINNLEIFVNSLAVAASNHLSA
jgi:hypothetical protein